jgi:hypothetical protein
LGGRAGAEPACGGRTCRRWRALERAVTDDRARTPVALSVPAAIADLHRRYVAGIQVALGIFVKIELATPAAEENVAALVGTVEAPGPGGAGFDGHPADRVGRLRPDRRWLLMLGLVVMPMVGRRPMDARPDEPSCFEALAPWCVEDLMFGLEPGGRGEACASSRPHGEVVAAAATLLDQIGSAPILD